MSREKKVIDKLKEKFNSYKLIRKLRADRYDAGDELIYKVDMLDRNSSGKVTLVIDKFVGGGFAGQVYRVVIKAIEGDLSPLGIGNIYAIKILIPPSGFSKFFRDAVYWIGFQGPFQLQVNPAASKAGALWQKFIRRAAVTQFGTDTAVVDIHATFIDETLGSCGEISEWVEGRTWQLEVDPHLDYLQKWQHNKKLQSAKIGSVEYRTKKVFMSDFVKMLNQMGAYEFARQYEWSTCKSQPNCLKRVDAEPEKGLVAVDFRAGLALLPFLPMSPGDFKLIFKGLFRGSLVQFDRGSIKKLRKYIDLYPEYFSDMKWQFNELVKQEKIYRNSLLDITHNHLKILFSHTLWKNILLSSVQGWQIKHLITQEAAEKLKKFKLLSFLLYIIGFIPFLGKYFIKLFCNKFWRNHYFKMIYNWKYLFRALKATSAEKCIKWFRDGRINEKKATAITNSLPLFLVHLILSILPVGLHKFLSNAEYFKERLWYIFVRPIRLYFDPVLRENWLRQMLADGRKKHILSQEDSDIIESQLNEPFIQKYLKSLAVHVCTLPITQVVSVIIAIIYVLTHPEMPLTQSWGIGLGIIALFQVIPISPGSLTRGLYVLYLVIKERDFKNYNIAVFLGFFKYIGYLAFPIQMTYKYPALARFMAVHWATDAVHIVPVFGEGGALLEHWVFRLFYNWPLTIRRQMNERKEIRMQQKPRYWHIPVLVLLFSTIYGLTDYYFLKNELSLPNIKSIWYWGMIMPILLGSFITIFARGLIFYKRIIASVVAAVSVGIIYTMVSWQLGFAGNLLAEFIWRFFIFSVFSVIGVMITELNLGSPFIKKELSK